MNWPTVNEGYEFQDALVFRRGDEVKDKMVTS